MEEKLQDACFKMVESGAMSVLDSIEEALESFTDEPLPCSPHFDAFIYLIHFLTIRGWSKDELKSEIDHHAEEAMKIN